MASIKVIELEEEEAAEADKGKAVPTEKVIEELGKLERVDVVMVGGCMSSTSLGKLNDACRLRASGFVALQSFGSYASFFCDLGARHRYKNPSSSSEGEVNYVTWQESLRVQPPTPRSVRDRISKLFYLTQAAMSVLDEQQQQQQQQQQDALRQQVTRWLTHHGLHDAVAKQWISDAEAAQFWTAATHGGELPAVTAVAGGLVGAELIKFLTATDPTLKNWWFYDATTGTNSVETLA
jgi:hypothetical protein